MILVSSKPIQKIDVEGKYDKNSTAYAVLEKLMSSPKEYSYDSFKQLDFELSLREEIVKAAKDLLKSGMGFEIFRESRCNDAYWTRTDEGGFIKKEGVKSSAAIVDIFANGHLYGTECATAMIIIYYKALLSIFPEKAFDSLFPYIHLMNWHYIDRLLKNTGRMYRQNDYLPGDRRYFKNPDVDPLTPEWQGENVIDLGGGMYYGHGIGIYNAENFIAMLNENRIEKPEQTAFLMDMAARPDFKNLSQIYEQSMAAQ